MEDIREISLGIAGKSHHPHEAHRESMHLCLIYRDEEERRQVVSKFLKYGLQHGEKIAYYADMITPPDLKTWLGNLDIDKNQLIDNQLNLFDSLDIYCPHGVFDMEPVLDRYGTYYKKAMEEGFKGARVTGETDWLLKKRPGSERFIEYEARLNNTLLKYPVATMCQYNANHFDGATIFDILQVHPFVVVHGQIIKNPAFVRPDEFLKTPNVR